MDLSIIIVSYNNKDLLKGAITSIYENTANRLKYEIIVVDNNSTDGTLKMLSESFPKVKTIDNDKNLGFAAANNIGLLVAKGKNIIFLNNDTFVLNDALFKMNTFLNSDPNIGGITPRLLEADEMTTQHQGRKNNRIWESKKVKAIKFASGTALMVRKIVLDRVGSFDESFFFYNEDLDLCKRIIDRGFKIYYYPQAEIIHYGGKSSEQVSTLAISEGLRGGIYYAYKHYRILFPFYLIIIILYLLISIIISVFNLLISSKTKKPFSEIKAYLLVLKYIFTFNIKRKRNVL